MIQQKTMNSKIEIMEGGDKIIIGTAEIDQKPTTGLIDVSKAAMNKARALKWKSPLVKSLE